MLVGLVLTSCNSSSDSSGDPEAENTIGYPNKLIEHGFYSGYTKYGGIEVTDVTLIEITSQEDLDEFWSLHKSNESPGSTTPLVDFNNKMLLVIICPVYSTGGYDIIINEIYENDKKLVVAATLQSPGSGCMVSQALTQPYTIVEIDFSDLPIALNLTRKTVNCL